MVALEILTLLLENATNDSVEVAIAFLKECGAKLEELSRRGIAGKCLHTKKVAKLMLLFRGSHFRKTTKHLTRGTARQTGSIHD